MEAVNGQLLGQCFEEMMVALAPEFRRPVKSLPSYFKLSMGREGVILCTQKTSAIPVSLWPLCSLLTGLWRAVCGRRSNWDIGCPGEMDISPSRTLARTTISPSCGESTGMGIT